MYGTDLAEETAFVLALRRLRELSAAIETGPADTEVYVGILVDDPGLERSGNTQPPPRVSRSHRGGVEVVVPAGPVSILALTAGAGSAASRNGRASRSGIHPGLGRVAVELSAPASAIGRLAIAGFLGADEPEEPSADDLDTRWVAVPSTDAETRLRARVARPNCRSGWTWTPRR